MISIGPRLLQGKTKDVYAVEPDEYLLLHFRDDVRGFNDRSQAVLPEKGIWAAGITTALFELLANHGVATHFVHREEPNKLLVKKMTMFPFYVVARNLVAGSLAHRFGLLEGTPLSSTIVEYYPINPAIGKQWTNASHILAFDWATEVQLQAIRQATNRINEILVPYLEEKGLVLVDFRLEFGLHDGGIYLGNELSPDNLRLWDMATSATLDADRFRQGVDEVRQAYFEIYRRVCLNE